MDLKYLKPAIEEYIELIKPEYDCDTFILLYDTFHEIVKQIATVSSDSDTYMTEAKTLPIIETFKTKEVDLKPEAKLLDDYANSDDNTSIRKMCMYAHTAISKALSALAAVTDVYQYDTICQELNLGVTFLKDKSYKNYEDGRPAYKVFGYWLKDRIDEKSSLAIPKTKTQLSYAAYGIVYSRDVYHSDSEYVRALSKCITIQNLLKDMVYESEEQAHVLNTTSVTQLINYMSINMEVPCMIMANARRITEIYYALLNSKSLCGLRKCDLDIVDIVYVECIHWFIVSSNGTRIERLIRELEPSISYYCTKNSQAIKDAINIAADFYLSRMKGDD